MKFALSTNWCSRTTAAGEAIAEKAAELGFDELEIGYAATQAQADGIKRRLDLIPVGSVHAFAPVPISAPAGHPELYSLADFDSESADFARFQLLQCIGFAADVGAKTVVLHAGKVGLSGLFDRLDSQRLKSLLRNADGDCRDRRYMKSLSLAQKRREKRGRRMLERFKPVLASLMPELEKRKVTLALENMPYLEGFPHENEMTAILAEFAGAPVKAWFDTGHHLVRVNHGWTRGSLPFPPGSVAGMHLNDVEGLNDDHLAPGEGKVDFSALGDAARKIRHLVFEPSGDVSEESLKRALTLIRKKWK